MDGQQPGAARIDQRQGRWCITVSGNQMVIATLIPMITTKTANTTAVCHAAFMIEPSRTTLIPVNGQGKERLSPLRAAPRA